MKTNKSANRETPRKGQSCAKRKKYIFNGEKFVETVYKGYFVSKSGKVISFRTCHRDLYGNNIDYSKKPKYVATYKGDRYLTLVISYHQKIKRISVHRLIYKTFIGNIPKNKVVDHIDGNKTNNAVSNLQLLTNEENIRKSNKGKPSKQRKQVIIKKGQKIYRFKSVVDSKQLIDFSVIKRARESKKFPNIPRKAGYIIYSFYEGQETIKIHISASKTRKYEK